MAASMSSAEATPVLEHADRLEPERDAEPRRREARGVRDDDRGLADRVHPARAPAATSVPSVRVAAHDLDERRGGHRVEEVQAEEPRRAGRAVRRAGRSRSTRCSTRARRPARSTASTRVRASILSSRSSGTASTTRSQRAKSRDVGARRRSARRWPPRRRRPCRGRRDAATDSSTRAAAAAAASASRSTTVTREPGEQERVRDARAHAPAAEHADVGRGTGRRSRSLLLPLEELGHAAELLGALEEHGLLLEVDGGVRGARRAEHALRRDGRGRGRCARCGRRSRARPAAARRRGAARSRARSSSASSASRVRPVSSSSFARASPTISLQAPARAGRGDDAEAGLGVADLQRGRGDADVGGVGELGAAAERVPVEGGDHGHRQVGDADERVRVDARGARHRPAVRAARRCRRPRRRRRRRRVRMRMRGIASSSAQSRCSASIVAWSIALRFVGAVERRDDAVVAPLDEQRRRVASASRHRPPSDALHDERGALADADAHRGEAVARAPRAPCGRAGSRRGASPTSRADAPGRSRRRRRSRARGRARAGGCDASDCVANASLSSTEPMSSRSRPARSSAFSVAGTGPRPMISGASPALVPTTTRARGVSP